jgi:hypothetical protein
MLLEHEPGSIFGGRLRARSALESIAGCDGTAALQAAVSPSDLSEPGHGGEPRAAETLADPAVPDASPARLPRRGLGVGAPDAVDERLIEILEAPLAAGETAAVGFRRKEAAIVGVLATLTALESRALLARIRSARAGDPLVEKLGRLTAERRQRLLAFLADARRREALQLARTSR